jgi:type VI secretion system Hcp family effector
MKILTAKKLFKGGVLAIAGLMAIALLIGAGEPTEPVPAAEARQFAVLHIPGVNGSYSVTPYPLGSMKVLHFEFSVTASDNSDMTDDPWSVHPKFSELTVTKEFDTASPDLNYNCAAGTHYPTATLMVIQTSPTSPPYYTVTLTDAVITKVRSRMVYRTSAPVGYTHLEEVSLKCGAVTWDMTGASPRSWDIEHNNMP